MLDSCCRWPLFLNFKRSFAALLSADITRVAGDVYLCFEGGPGVAEEAQVAYSRGGLRGHGLVVFWYLYFIVLWNLKQSYENRMKTTKIVLFLWFIFWTLRFRFLKNQLQWKGHEDPTFVLRDLQFKLVNIREDDLILFDSKSPILQKPLVSCPELTGARVVPFIGLGGASGGEFGFPLQALEVPSWCLVTT